MSTMTHGRYVAALIADPARSVILTTLLDGRALPAGELAYAAGITAQTASTHLSKLLSGGLVTVVNQGRHRYFRLAGPDVASALEALSAIAPPSPVRRPTISPEARKLKDARCCYDHLAGRLGVAITDALVQRGFIVEAGKQFKVTSTGEVWLLKIGLDVSAMRPGRLGIAKCCLDWTERKPHVGGPLGAALLELWRERDWLRRLPASREIALTQLGFRWFKENLGIDAHAADAT